MTTVRNVLRGLLDNFRAGARTLGISPKALAPFIGAGITALLALVGLTPDVIGGWIDVSPLVVVGGITTVAGTIAAALLRPGRVEPPSNF
jgi:hypothetical protein